MPETRCLGLYPMHGLAPLRVPNRVGSGLDLDGVGGINGAHAHTAVSFARQQCPARRAPVRQAGGRMVLVGSQPIAGPAVLVSGPAVLVRPFQYREQSKLYHDRNGPGT